MMVTGSGHIWSAGLRAGHGPRAGAASDDMWVMGSESCGVQGKMAVLQRRGLRDSWWLSSSSRGLGQNSPLSGRQGKKEVRESWTSGLC